MTNLFWQKETSIFLVGYWIFHYDPPPLTHMHAHKHTLLLFIFCASWGLVYTNHPPTQTLNINNSFSINFLILDLIIWSLVLCNIWKFVNSINFYILLNSSLDRENFRLKIAWLFLLISQIKKILLEKNYFLQRWWEKNIVKKYLQIN